MDWLKKLLQAQGMTEEQITAIVGGVEENYKSHIPKHRFDEVNEAKKQLETDIKDRDTQLSDIKKSAGDNEELKKQIGLLQTDNIKKDEDYQAKIKDISVTSAIEKALTAANAKFPDLLLGKIDKEKIELLQDGTIKGLEDQLTPLKESYKDLFGETKIVGGQPGSGGNPDPNPDPSKMTDEEFYKQALKEEKK
jgi:membrane-associated HD superfamily phosphohydrolase